MKRTNETPDIFKKGHETFLKNVSIIVDSMTIRFVKPDVAIATVFSTQHGTSGLPEGVDKSISNCASDRLISTIVIVNQNDKWLITQYQNGFNFIAAR